MISIRTRLLGAIAASLLIANSASAALTIGARTLLQRCGDDTCVVLTGHRSDAAARVLIAGRPVLVEGQRRWRVALPLGTIRAWSSPAARTIAVAVDGGEVAVPLPIGLLSHGGELAFLEVRAR